MEESPPTLWTRQPLHVREAEAHGWASSRDTLLECEWEAQPDLIPVVICHHVVYLGPSMSKS